MWQCSCTEPHFDNCSCCKEISPDKHTASGACIASSKEQMWLAWYAYYIATP